MGGERRSPLRRPGRPRRATAKEDTREQILAAAAKLFAQEGYDAASMRGVAREAGVDPALVRHYFTDKAELFTESIAAPMRPDRIVTTVLAGPREHIGENLVRAILQTLEQPGTSARVIRLMHTALGQEFAARMLRQFVMREILKRIAKELGDDDAELRASFAATQMVGLVIARYGLKIEPLASASLATVIARIGPVLQWHLTGTVPAPVPPMPA